MHFRLIYHPTEVPEVVMTQSDHRKLLRDAQNYLDQATINRQEIVRLRKILNVREKELVFLKKESGHRLNEARRWKKRFKQATFEAETWAGMYFGCLNRFLDSMKKNAISLLQKGW